MTETLETLESLRNQMQRKISEIGDFQPGSVYPSYRKCGRKNCACAKPGHAGHLQYLRTKATGGKIRTQSLRMGPQLEKAVQEAENYRQFMKLSRELVAVNERICELRPIREVNGPEEFEALKKKLQKKFSEKLRKK